MIIFTKKDLSEMSWKQLNSLRRYYKLDRMKKQELVDVLYILINPRELPPLPGTDQSMSVRVRRIYEQNIGE